MSWEMHEAAKKIADGWYSELEATRKRNAVLGHENAKLRGLVKSMYYDITHMTFPPDWVTDYEADMRELGVEED